MRCLATRIRVRGRPTRARTGRGRSAAPRRAGRARAARAPSPCLSTLFQNRSSTVTSALRRPAARPGMRPRCDLDRRRIRRTLHIFACSASIKLPPKAAHLRRNPARPCDPMKADDGSRTRDLRLPKPTLDVRFQLIRAIRWFERPVNQAISARKVASDRCPNRPLPGPLPTRVPSGPACNLVFDGRSEPQLPARSSASARPVLSGTESGHGMASQ